MCRQSEEKERARGGGKTARADGDKEVGRGRGMKDSKDNGGGGGGMSAGGRENGSEDHTYREEMKTNYKENRSEYERGREGGDKLPLCSCSALSPGAASSISVSVSLRSRAKLFPQRAAAAGAGHVRGELSEPSEMISLLQTTPPRCCAFVEGEQSLDTFSVNGEAAAAAAARPPAVR